jgi:hypothetical protein
MVEVKKEVEGVNSSMIYLIYFKNFYKCHNVPHPAQQLKKKRISVSSSVKKNSSISQRVLGKTKTLNLNAWQAHSKCSINASFYCYIKCLVTFWGSY